MANQYSDNFKAIMEKRYKENIIDILLNFRSQNKTYSEVANISGFNITTVKRWAYRYAIYLRIDKRIYKRTYIRKSGKEEAIKQHEKFLEKFRSSKINIFNVLSRRWL